MPIEVNYWFFHVNKTMDLGLISCVLNIDIFVKKAYSVERSRSVCSVLMNIFGSEAVMVTFYLK